MFTLWNRRRRAALVFLMCALCRGAAASQLLAERNSRGNAAQCRKLVQRGKVREISFAEEEGGGVSPKR